MEFKTKDVNSTIPDLYYDLIARAVPGAAFLLEVTYLSLPEDFSFHRVTDISVGFVTAAIVILLGTGYVVSLLITPLGEHGRRLYSRILWKAVLKEDSEGQNALKQRLDISFTGKESIATLERNYRVLHDHIRATDPSARTLVLSKMQAEAAFCTNLFSCSVLLLIVLAVKRGIEILTYALPFSFLISSPTRTCIAIAVPLLSGYAAFDRNKRNLERHFVFLRRLASKDQQASTASAT